MDEIFGSYPMGGVVKGGEEEEYSVVFRLVGSLPQAANSYNCCCLFIAHPLVIAFGQFGFLSWVDPK